MKRLLAWFSAVLLSLGFLFGLVSPAAAAPPTDPWTGAAGGDVTSLDLDLVLGTDLAGLRLATTQSTVSSTGTPRVRSASSNLGAAVVGLGVTVETNTQTAPPDNPGPVTGSLLDVSAAGVSLTGLTTSDEAHWGVDTACVTNGVLADSRVRTAGATLPLNLLTTGVSRTQGVTELVATGGGTYNRGVRSTATGAIAGATVLGLVGVAVAGDSTLTAQADGTPGSASFDWNPGVVTVTVAGVPTVLAVGASRTIDLGPVGAVTLRANDLTTSPAANGQSASASVSVVTLQVRVGSALAPTAQATIELLPLRAAATVPSGGIDCPPPAPVVQTPANNAVINDATPTYSGTGVAGSTINLTVDGATSTGVATVAGNGLWSYTPTTDLGEGAHSVSATQTLNGSTSSSSNTNNFTVDTVAPPAPTLATPANGSITNDTTPSFTGAAAANSTVRVFVDGTQIGTTTADGAGNFSFTPTTAIAEGTHAAFARAVDAAGNVSANSNTNSFTIDTTDPAAPVVTAPANGSSTDDTTPTISGTTETGTTVEVFLDGASVGPATVTGTTWTLTPTTAVAEGPHTVYAVASDAAGNDAQSNTNTFTVDTTDPTAPTVTTPADGSRTNDTTPPITGTTETGTTVEVFLDGNSLGPATVTGTTWTLTPTTALTEGPHTVYAVATDPAGNESPNSATNTFTVDSVVPTAPVINVPTDGATVSGPYVTVGGLGEAGAEVVVTDQDGTEYGPVTVTPAGTWSVVLPNLPNGTFTVTAVQTDQAGNESPPSNSRTFTVDSAAAAAPVILQPVSGTSTNDVTPTISGTATANLTVTVTLDNGIELGPIPVDGSGNWTTNAPTLADGPYTVVATQSDGGGTESAESAPVTFIVDTGVPAAPTLENPPDNSATNDQTPTFSGLAEPNATVRVILDGTLLGTTTATAGGTFTFTPAANLTVGPHTAYAQAVDAAGNPSPNSPTNAFTVDTTPPAAPVVVEPADGSSTNDTTPTIAGTTEAGTEVEVFLDGTSLGQAAVTGTAWTLTAPTALPPGSYEVSAVATDVADNEAESNTNTFTIDTAAPAPPVITEPDDGDEVGDTPTIVGTVDPGSTVTVVVDGQPVGETTADGNGDWAFTPADPLTPGDHEIVATATDAAGNTSAPSESVTVTVREIADPLITEPAEGAVLTDTTPTISGTAEPDSALTLRYATDSTRVGARARAGELIGTTTAAADGSWDVTVPDALDPGSYAVVATQAVGGFADRASNVRRFSIPNADGVTPPVITTPEPGTEVSSPVQVCGTGEPGASIRIVDGDGTVLAGTTVLGDGTFCVEVELEPGSQIVRAVQTVGDDTQTSPEIRFSVSDGGGNGGNGGGGTSGGGGGSSGSGSGSSGSLPDTGGPGPAALVVAVLLLAGGGIAFAMSRRRT